MGIFAFFAKSGEVIRVESVADGISLVTIRGREGNK